MNVRRITHALMVICCLVASAGARAETPGITVLSSHPEFVSSGEGNTRCNALYPAFSLPRMVAGEPLTNDVLKCQLKPVDAADYGGKLGEDEFVELKDIFPNGVCDYSKPGVGQAPTRATWQSF